MLVAQVHGALQPAIAAPLPDDAYSTPRPDGTPGGMVSWQFNNSACGSDGNCTVTGYYVSHTNASKRAVLMDLVDGQWQPANVVVLPGNAAGPTQGAPGSSGPSDSRTFGIDCFGGGKCSATGTYTDATGGTQLMFVSRG
jgi:hypothetical protein